MHAQSSLDGTFNDECISMSPAFGNDAVRHVITYFVNAELSHIKTICCTYMTLC